jgi:hypothetical protein
MTKDEKSPTPVEKAVAVPSPLKLTWDAPIKVEVVEKEKPPPEVNRLTLLLRFAAIFFAVSFALLGALLGYFFLRPRNYLPPAGCAPEIEGLSIALSYPSYIATGDEGYIDVTVINGGEREITGTVVVVFKGPISVQSAVSESSVIEFTALKSGGRETRRVRFSLNESPLWFSDEVVRFHLLAAVEGSEKKLEEHIIQLAPIPYLKTGFSWLMGSSFVAGLISALWDEIRRRIF